jgi:type IV pilus assembly protein PilY1
MAWVEKWCLFFILLVSLGGPLPVAGDELDLYRSHVKNNCMLIVDTSPSMNYPVYDASVNYARIMEKLVLAGMAYDDADAGSSETWSRDSQSLRYDRFDPDNIFLVSVFLSYHKVTRDTGPGIAETVIFLEDIMTHLGDEKDPARNRRYGLLTLPVIPLRSPAGVPWSLTEPLGVARDEAGHLLFPDGDLVLDTGEHVFVPSGLGGRRLPNRQGILVDSAGDDAGIGMTASHSFLNVLRESGYYFSGCFEDAATGNGVTSQVESAQAGFSGLRAYFFATGNWLNFLKLVEDFNMTAEQAEMDGFDEAVLPMPVKAWRSISFWPDGTTVSNTRQAPGAFVRISSRLEYVLDPIKALVGEESHHLNWGLTVTGREGSGAVVLAPLGAQPSGIIALLDTMTADGTGNVGEALQIAYNSNKGYLDSYNAVFPCSRSFMLLASDGFAGSCENWSIIDDRDAPLYPNPTFGRCAGGYGSADCSRYGDADTWPGTMHLDDLAHWLSGEASRRHALAAVLATRGSPYIEDVAVSGDGKIAWAADRQAMADLRVFMGDSWLDPPVVSAPFLPVDLQDASQTGQNLFLSVFQPVEYGDWTGNLKKYGLNIQQRAECGQEEETWGVVDQNNAPVFNCEGTFNAAAVSNWSTRADGGIVASGGSGERLLIRRDEVIGDRYYDFRSIYTCKESDLSNTLVRLHRNSITPDDLQVSTPQERDAVINYLYGYTRDAEPITGLPMGMRDWMLGAMVHSEPCIIDYRDDGKMILHRFIAVGANDGMLHVFVDDIDPRSDADTTIGGHRFDPGDEIWAFIPGDLLGQLRALGQGNRPRWTVDGSPVLHRSRLRGVDGDEEEVFQEKTLIFGLRRGGRTYWALDVSYPDPARWAVKWRITGGQGSFGELGQTWSTPATASIQISESARQEVVIFGGGYDPEEDQIPEPWDDVNRNGRYDSGEPYTDSSGNGRYDVYNPEINGVGRAIYVVDLDRGEIVFAGCYGSTPSITRTIQSTPGMAWCFPAAPGVVELPRSLHIYITDVYAALWKIDYRYGRDPGWSLKKVFQSNPGDDRSTALVAASDAVPGLPAADAGRKSFESLEVSYFGNAWTDMPVVYFGTGDRIHPRQVPPYSNRFYAIADTGVLADETHLINLTCNELGTNVDITGDGRLDQADSAAKQLAADILRGIQPYPDRSGDDQCRGWYKLLSRQGECHGQFEDHAGEMTSGKPVLFDGTIYFVTYQPDTGEGCLPEDRGRVYALDYSHGSALLPVGVAASPSSGDPAPSISLAGEIGMTLAGTGMPSGVSVIVRQGRAGGLVGQGAGVAEAAQSAVGDPQTFCFPVSTPPGETPGFFQLLWEPY